MGSDVQILKFLILTKDPRQSASEKYCGSAYAYWRIRSPHISGWDVLLAVWYTN